MKILDKLLFFVLFSCYLSASQIDTLNIKKLGAIGDGKKDDSDVFINAFKSIKENQILFIPKGVYILKKSINIDVSNIKVIGEGEQTQLKFSSPKFSKSKKLLYSFILSNAKNIEFTNFCIDGGATNYKQIIIDDYKKQTWDVDGAYHIFFINPIKEYSVDNITFRNLKISNSFFDAIHTYGRLNDVNPKFKVKNIFIEDCEFNSIGGHGVGFNNVLDSYVKQSKFYNVGLMKMTNANYGSGLAVDVSAGCNDILIKDNIVEGAGGGFKCETHHINNYSVNYSQNIQFINNTIKKLYQGDDYKVFYGIKMNGLNCKADGNIIESYGHGILIGIDAKDNIITNNTILNTNEKTAAGIRCDENGGGHQIISNRIYNTKAQGILIANSNNVNIDNNIIGFTELDNLRIAGGFNITISNNYLFNSKSFSVSIAPIGQMKINNVKIIDNFYFNTNDTYYKTKGILIVSGLNNISNIKNTLLIKRDNINTFLNNNIGDLIINEKFEPYTNSPLLWEISLCNGSKSYRIIN
ncbi:glycoside hydrolase family 55 protein [Empedobacter falsenii]